MHTEERATPLGAAYKKTENLSGPGFLSYRSVPNVRIRFLIKIGGMHSNLRQQILNSVPALHVFFGILEALERFHF